MEYKKICPNINSQNIMNILLEKKCKINTKDHFKNLFYDEST